MFELRQLAYFLNIAEAGSLSQAALQLQVSQSMLSRGIQQFEGDLGHRLFHRTGRGMQLTEFGRHMLPLAQQATMELTRFAHEAKALRGRLSGTVAIGLPGSIAARVVAPLVRLTQRQHPELSLRCVEGLSGGVEDWREQHENVVRREPSQRERERARRGRVQPLDVVDGDQNPLALAQKL